MLAKLLRLLLQGRSVLFPHVPRGGNHGESLLLPLLLIGRRVLLLGQFLALHTAELLTTLTALGNSSHPLLVRSLGLLLHTNDNALGEEVVGITDVVGFASGSESGELASGGSSSSVVGFLLGGRRAELVDLGEIGGGKDLESEGGWSVSAGEAVQRASHLGHGELGDVGSFEHLSRASETHLVSLVGVDLLGLLLGAVPLDVLLLLGISITTILRIGSKVNLVVRNRSSDLDNLATTILKPLLLGEGQFGLLATLLLVVVVRIRDIEVLSLGRDVIPFARGVRVGVGLDVPVVPFGLLVDFLTILLALGEMLGKELWGRGMSVVNYRNRV